MLIIGYIDRAILIIPFNLCKNIQSYDQFTRAFDLILKFDINLLNLSPVLPIYMTSLVFERSSYILNIFAFLKSSFSKENLQIILFKGRDFSTKMFEFSNLKLNA